MGGLMAKAKGIRGQRLKVQGGHSATMDVTRCKSGVAISGKTMQGHGVMGGKKTQVWGGGNEGS